jgi:hypothetical protein
MLLHEATGATASKSTNPTGEFQFDFLRIGRYTLTIQAPGFRKYEANGIELGGSQLVRQTFRLEVGSMSETVEVTAQSPMLNTVAPEQRESLSERHLEELPLSRRNVQNLLSLGTGVDTSDGGGVRLNGFGHSGVKIPWTVPTPPRIRRIPDLNVSEL